MRALQAIERLPGVLRAEPHRRTISVRLRNGHLSRKLAITGKPADMDLSRVLDSDFEPVRLPEAGLVVDEHLAEVLKLRRGDLVELELLEGRRVTLMVAVADIIKSYFGLVAFMDLDALQEIAGDADWDMEKARCQSTFPRRPEARQPRRGCDPPASVQGASVHACATTPSSVESFDATNRGGVIVCSPEAGRMLYQLKRLYLGVLAFALATGLAAAGLAGPAQAQRGDGQGQSRTADVPMMAVVSLSRQRVTVYNARGGMLEAPVSTGQAGYETPAGIYSVIQKHRDHYSNLYENAPMPFMQRITWSGIALHGGALPGYPASHGCIRLPHDFARQLFELTKMGMRVVVVRDDMLPVDFAHPGLFRPGAPSPDQPDAKIENAALAPRMTRRSIAAAKVAAAEAAAQKARHARRAASRARQEAAAYLERLEIAEGAKMVAEATVKEADALLQAEVSPRDGKRLKATKAKAQDRLSAAQAQIDAIHAEGKAKIDGAAAARAEAKAAREASAAAEEEARLAAPAPVSVFISRATRRLYVRQSFEPVFESDVTIRDPSAPIGTTLFTALGYAGNDTDELRWSALAMYRGPANLRPAPDPGRRRGGEPARTDAAAAKAALERIAIPQHALDRINELVTPGSSLIVSDEETSRETRKGTDFVVLMSGEPQGGVKRRRLRPDLFSGYGVPRSRGVDSGPISWW